MERTRVFLMGLAAAVALAGCSNLVCDDTGKACTCALGDCELTCPEGGCQLTCAGESCSLNCPGNECQMTCSSAAKSCKLTGCTKDCQLACLGAGSCESSCTGAVDVCQTTP